MQKSSLLLFWIKNIVLLVCWAWYSSHVAYALSAPPIPSYVHSPNFTKACEGQVDILYRSEGRIYAYEWCESKHYIASVIPNTGKLNWRFSIPHLPDEPGFGRNAYTFDGAGEHGVLFYDAIKGTPALLNSDGQFTSFKHFAPRERFNEPSGVSIFDGKQFIWNVVGSEVVKYDITTGKKTKVAKLPVENLVKSVPYALALYDDKLLVIRQLSSRLLGNNNVLVMDTKTGAVVKKNKYSSTAPQAIYYFKSGKNDHFIVIYLNSGAWLVEPLKNEK